MSKSQEVWKETGGETKYLSTREQYLLRSEEIVRNLARCPECGGKASVYEFGVQRHGVWVGCIKTPECARHVEYHREGWSLFEVAAEWNRKNRGINRQIRRAKSWLRRKVYPWIERRITDKSNPERPYVVIDSRGAILQNRV